MPIKSLNQQLIGINSLREYYSDISINAELQKLLHETEILLKKKMTDLAKKILLKAEKLATEHEADDYLIAIYSLKERVLNSSRNIKEREHHFNYDILKERQCIERNNNNL